MKTKTANNNNAIGEADLVVEGENNLEEESIMEDILTGEENQNEMDITEFYDNNKLINDDAVLNAKDILFAEKANNDNEIDVTQIFDCSNLSLSVGIAEDIPIFISNTPDKAQHEAQHDVPVETSLEQLSPVLEPNFQQMETKVATTPTSKNKQDFNSETYSNLEKELSPLPQNAVDEFIPTPFKKSLFWPTPKVDQIAKRKVTKDKVPAVATSSQWQQYYKKKEEKKEQEEKLKMQRKKKRTQRKEMENEKKKAKIAVSQNLTERTSNRRATDQLQNVTNKLNLIKRSSNRRATDKLQNVTKKLFSIKGTELSKPSTSKPLNESWYCVLCDTEDQLDMRLCSSSLKYYHEACLGLPEDDTEEFQCPFCQ